MTSTLPRDSLRGVQSKKKKGEGRTGLPLFAKVNLEAEAQTEFDLPRGIDLGRA